jgi:DNA-binding NtrC family response regulator
MISVLSATQASRQPRARPPLSRRLWQRSASRLLLPAHCQIAYVFAGNGSIVVITHTTLLEEGDPFGPDDPPGPHVLVMSPDAFSSVRLPTEGAVSVGRSSKCGIRIDDPLASREHARLHVNPVSGGFTFIIEDLGSANGTRVRDVSVAAGQTAPFVPGDAIAIGSTVLMVQHTRPAVGTRRLWSHAYFESRLSDECARAAAAGASFAMARVRLTGTAPWTRVLPILVRTIPLPHLFAAYGPLDYEILFLETEASEVTRQVEHLVSELQAVETGARHSVVWYPRDGRSTDALLAKANAGLRPSVAGAGTGEEARTLPGAGAGMERLRGLAKRAATSNISVLILGETGVGKDVLAQEVHRLSPRGGPLVVLNCAGLAETLIESELFGHERGAFTGAARAKLGLLEAGNGGTVFLDEIGEMPISLQPKLLRAIEKREVLPVGAVKPRTIDVRFIAATNRDLEAEVERGAFRRDLYFRLNGITLAIPPLRERTDEIPALVTSFIAEMCRDCGRERVPTMTAEAMGFIQGYDWPGNIRELKNVVERALVLCDSDEILPQFLPLDKMTDLSLEDSGATPMRGAGIDRGELPSVPGIRPDQLPPLDDPKKLAERQSILDALAHHAGNQTRAAQSLGMPRRTFITKLDQYGIPRPQKTSSGRA